MNGNTTRQDLFIFRGTYRECMLEPTKDMHIYLAWDTGEIFIGNAKGYKVRYGANSAEIEAMVKKYETAIKADLKKEYQDKLLEILAKSPVDGAQAIIENMATKGYVNDAAATAVEKFITDTNIQNDLNTLTSRVNSLTAKTNNITDNVNSLNNRVNSLNSEINNKIDSLGTEVNSKIDTLGTTVNNRVDNLSNTVNSKINNLDNNINTRIDSLDSDVDEINNNLTDLSSDLTNLSEDVTNLSEDVTGLKNQVIPDTADAEEGWVLTVKNGVPTWAKSKGGGAPVITSIKLSATWQPTESKIEISSGSINVKVRVSAVANADKIASLKVNDTAITLNSDANIENLNLTTPKSRVYTITGTTNDEEYEISSLSKTLTVYQPSLFYADDVEEKRESYLGNYSLSSGVHYYLYIPTNKSINKILTSDGFGYIFTKEANQVQMTVNGVVADYWKYDLNAPYMDVDIVIS